jgi:hypothetical protein
MPIDFTPEVIRERSQQCPEQMAATEGLAVAEVLGGKQNYGLQDDRASIDITPLYHDLDPDCDRATFWNAINDLIDPRLVSSPETGEEDYQLTTEGQVQSSRRFQGD